MFPKFKIQAHVLTYSLILGGGTIFALIFSEMYRPTEEQKRSILLKKYPDQIKKNEVQRQQMQDFFNEMKLAKNKDQALNTKFKDVLKGGKSNMKRWHDLQSTSIVADDVDQSSNNSTASNVAIKTMSEGVGAKHNNDNNSSS